MTDEPTDLERRVADWLEEGPLEPAQWAVDDAIRQAAATPRRRGTLLRSRDMRTIWLAAGVAAAAVILIGVINLAPGASTGAPPSASPSPSVVEPSGSWITQVHTNPDGTAVGPWTITFTHLQVFFRSPVDNSFGQGVTYSNGRFTLDADDCASGTGPGVWQWSVSGDAMTLTLVSDPSSCRKNVLGSGPLQRAP